MDNDDLTRLSVALTGRRVRIVELQTALTACGVRDMQHVDALDTRVTDGIRPNLVARVPGKSAQTLWIFGHTDVVPPGDSTAWNSVPWTVRQADDRLYGRGVEDNQQAIAGMLILAEELHALRMRPRFTLGLVFMADEECGSDYGLGHLLQHANGLFSPDVLYIVPDAGSPDADRIEVAEKGQLWLQVRITGEQCHAAMPHKGSNAFLAGADMALTCHHCLHTAFPGRNPLFEPPCSTFVPSKHEANVPNINTVPGSDVFYVDCRLLSDVSPEAVLAKTRAVARKVAGRHNVDIVVNVVREHSPQEPVVEALRKAVSHVYDVCARPIGVGGSTVAALLRHRGFPVAVWSCLANTCHQPDEYSMISATIKDAQVFAHILMHADHA